MLFHSGEQAVDSVPLVYILIQITFALSFGTYADSEDSDQIVHPHFRWLLTDTLVSAIT